MRLLALLTRPVLWALMGVIRVYQLTLSRVIPPICRFHPTCSRYSLCALRERGLFAGSVLMVWRIVRCQPFCAGGYDPVPPTGLRRVTPPNAPVPPEAASGL